MNRLLALTAMLLSACSHAPNPYETGDRSSDRRVAIPLPEGSGFRISQGAFGSTTHRSEYAWDFDVPYGTLVTAADSGRVIDVWEPKGGGGCDPKFLDTATNVKIRHADGTVAQYVHVQASVRVGEDVERGEPIGTTNSSGFHCSPQLHFSVYRDEASLPSSSKPVTLPLSFDGIAPDGVAREGLERSASDAMVGRAGRGWIPHPMEGSKRVEYFWMKPSGPGPWPVVIAIHGHQEEERTGGLASLPWLRAQARLGRLALALSQPGYGGSDGPSDYCGPFTQAALEGLIAHVRRQFGAPRIALYGVSRGAIVAGMVATRDASLAGVVLVVGIYAMEEAYRELARDPETRGIAASMVAEGASTKQAFAERSPLLHLRGLRAPTLVLASSGDHRVSQRQAEELVTRLKRLGRDSLLHVFKGYGHTIPQEARAEVMVPFLRRVL